MARMEFGHNLRLSQDMQMQITPQQIMAANLLQLQQMSLESRLRQELEENPALEMVQKKDDEEKDDALAEVETPPEEQPENDIYNEYQRDLDPRYVRRDDEQDKQHIIEATHQRNVTLREHIESQLWELDLFEHERIITEVVLINLTPDGFLKLDEQGVPLIYSDPRFERDDLELVLEMIRTLDPPGIAAESHQQSLLIQLDQLDGDFPVARKILSEHYDDLLMNRLPKIASALGIGIEGVKDAIEVIRINLTPNPAGEFVKDEPRYIIPDVVVTEDGDGFTVRLNNDFADGIKISSEFKRKLRDSVGDQRNFMKDRLVGASMLIKAIEQRRETLMRITEMLIERQIDWFKGTREVPVGITRYDIAQDIGVHHSTVSRGVMDKYIQTPRGIFPFHYFFGGSLDVRPKGAVPIGMADESEKSVKEIKEVIREIIAAENKRKPLSDSKIQQMVSERTDVKIARRTVAKYRESLGILSSSKRKEY